LRTSKKTFNGTKILFILMKRIIEIKESGLISKDLCHDNIILDYDSRNKRRSVMITKKKQEVILDLEGLKVINDRSVFVLEDKSYIYVEAKSEKLLKIKANSATTLNKIIWHIGNRHVPAEIKENSIFIAYDYVLEDMIKKLGGDIKIVNRAFNPEKGAYSGGHNH